MTVTSEAERAAECGEMLAALSGVLAARLEAEGSSWAPEFWRLADEMREWCGRRERESPTPKRARARAKKSTPGLRVILGGPCHSPDRGA